MPAVKAAGNPEPIQRLSNDCFAVAYCPPYKCPDEPWEDIGTVATQEEATALAQAHNDGSA